jgi:hypothetical protein
MQLTRPYHEFNAELNAEELLSYQYSELVFEWCGPSVTVDIMVSRKTQVWHQFGVYEGGFAHIIVGPVWAVRFRQDAVAPRAKGRAAHESARHGQISGVMR